MPVEVMDVAGMRVTIESFGEATPTLVFVHGGFCDRHDWDAQCRTLQREFRVVTFDLPGHGESGSLPKHGGVDALVEVTAEIVKRKALSDTVLVGHSFGCRLALEALRKFPLRGCAEARIAGVGLIEGRLVSKVESAQVAAVLRESDERLLKLLRKSFESNFVSSSEPAVRERVMSRLDNLDPSLVRALLRDTIAWDIERAQSVIPVDLPVLVIQSTDTVDSTRTSLRPDQQTEWTRLIAQTVMDQRLLIVPNVGHFTQIEAAEEVNTALAAFARRCVSLNLQQAFTSLEVQR
jgi:pimeloyl-ACP methyl ester carboxylesterase